MLHEVRPPPLSFYLQVFLRYLFLQERHAQAQASERRHAEVLFGPGDLPVQVPQAAEEGVAQQPLVAALPMCPPEGRTQFASIQADTSGP